MVATLRYPGMNRGMLKAPPLIPRTYTSQSFKMEFVALNMNTILTSRQTKFIAIKSNNRKVGLNALANRFYILNNRIPFCELNKSFESFKLFCKKEFM